MKSRTVRTSAVPSVPERVEPQLATLVSAPPIRGPWAYEIKLDGYRILARCAEGEVRLFTRNGNDWTAKMPNLERDLAKVAGKSAWLDGEIVVMADNGLPDFNALQNAFDKRLGTEQMVYFVFDLLYLEGRDLRPLTLQERRTLLEELLADCELDHVRLSQTFDADGPSVLHSACSMGLEGIIAKRLDSSYESGVRSDTWLKVKCQLRQEFVVGGFVTRTGSKQEIGSLLLGVYDEQGRLRSVGAVGSGWDSKTAVALLQALEPLELKTMAFDPEFAPTKGRWSRRPAGGERWVQPTIVVEVSFTEWTPDGHIRHPKFHGIRRDKPAREIHREVAT